jgi:hypothetical protein
MAASPPGDLANPARYSADISIRNRGSSILAEPFHRKPGKRVE